MRVRRTWPSGARLLGGSADIVFDCVAIQSSLDQANRDGRQGGNGGRGRRAGRGVTVPLPIIQDHQIRIQGSATYCRGLRGVGFTAERRHDQEGGFVTATRPLEAVAEAFELASSDST